MRTVKNIKKIGHRELIRVSFFIFHFSFFIFLLISCLERNSYPIEPHIEFVSFEKIDNGSGIDDEGVLIISFTDGDGDLGNIDEKDSTLNYFIIYQEKQQGVYITYEELINSFSASLPHFVFSDKKQAIDGTIQRRLNIAKPPDPYSESDYDTIRFECWLLDRAKHESNHIFTPEIIVKKR